MTSTRKHCENNNIMIIEWRPVMCQTLYLSSFSQAVMWFEVCVINSIFQKRKPRHREVVMWHSKVIEPVNGQGTVGILICLPPESFPLHTFSTGWDTLQQSSCEIAVYSICAEPVCIVQVTESSLSGFHPHLVESSWFTFLRKQSNYPSWSQRVPEGLN